MSDNRTNCDSPEECTHLALVMQELKNLTTSVNQLKVKVDEINDWMHTTKGAILIIATLVIGSIGAIATWILKRW